MAKKPYRIELTFDKKNKRPRYYLVKDVRVKDRKGKVLKFIGSNEPTFEEKTRFYSEYAYELEVKAALKKAELSSSYYKSDYINSEVLRNLEEIKYIYKTLMELMTVNEIETYEENFEVYYIYGTTSIEGNTLSLDDTQKLLLYNILPKDKQLREVNEVQNFKKVLKYRNRYKGKVTLEFIKMLHNLIMSNIDNESAGTFRRTDAVGISGCDLRLCPYPVIETELAQIITTYYQELANGKHPFEQAIIFHYRFEAIHPFSDGNGRVGREILNYMLKANDLPKLLFLGKDRSNYVNALRKGDDADLQGMVSVFADIIMKQRRKILFKNLKEMTQTIRKSRQMKLSDFIEITS